MVTKTNRKKVSEALFDDDGDLIGVVLHAGREVLLVKYTCGSVFIEDLNNNTLFQYEAHNSPLTEQQLLQLTKTIDAYVVSNKTKVAAATVTSDAAPVETTAAEVVATGSTAAQEPQTD